MRHAALPLALVLFAEIVAAQTITTVVGGGPNNLPALEANLVSPRAVKFDSAGNFYIGVGTAVLKVDSAGLLTLVAGDGTSSFRGDGGLAIKATLNGAGGVAVDAAGNVFIADTSNHRVRRVDAATGIISTAVGNGIQGLGCDACAATSANLSLPMDVAVDAAGNLYVLERGGPFFFGGGGHRIRRVAAATGTITTVAGTGGAAGFSGDGGPATSARLSSPSALALDAAGNLFIADSGNHRIRRVTAATGIIITVAGNGLFGFGGDGGPATSASLAFPLGVVVDSAGNLYVADTNNRRIRKVDSSNVITTIAGNGNPGGTGDGGPATSATFGTLSGVAVGASGDLLVADQGTLRVREVVASSGLIRTIAGNGTARFSGDGYAATGASLNFPLGVAVDGSGILYLSDGASNRVRRVDANGTITTFVGGGIRGSVATPYALAVDASGNLYIADQANHRIKKVDHAGTVSTVAGTGARGFSGDAGPATSALLNFPSGVAADASGNIYVADSHNHRVRKVDPAGVITTVADGFSFPRGVAVDSAGNLYIADTGRCRIRKVDTAGIVTTVAGDGRCFFGNGDGIPATSASLNEPEGVLVDASGGLFIADTRNNRVRRIDSSGIIRTVAGNGARAFGGDDGPATSASLALPTGIASDPSGALYVADRFNHRIRRVEGVACADRDTTPPLIQCASADDLWHRTNVLLACTASDERCGLADPSDSSFSLSTNVPAGSELADASTGIRQVCDLAGNCATAGPIARNKVDKRAPHVACGTADGLWHATDVNIACNAADGGSGLAVPADASFSLSTSIPPGTETSNASTGTRQICDAVLNCVMAGPVAANRVDKKPPAITITAPAGDYLLNQAAAANYACADDGSGLAACTGTIANGSNIDTSSVGAKSFTVNATDNVGNASSPAANYNVTYNILLLFDNTTAKKSGSVFAIRLQIADVNGSNRSAGEIAVTATRIVRISDNAPAPVDDAGNANPDSNFRFDHALGGTGGYIFNLSTQGLSTGTYRLFFTAAGDPVEHSLEFQVK